MKSQVIQPVTIDQAKHTIAQAARIYFRRDSQGRYLINRRRARPICLMGPAGVGKTEIVRQVAQEQGLAFLSYSVTHHTRQSIIGLPRLVDGTVDGRSVSMTECTMSEIIAQVHRTMEETGTPEGILFLDEFNCASESLRPILLQLLQDKSFGPHPIPDGWMLVLAGNPPEYNLGAGDLDPVTADRLRLLHIQPDYQAWRAYMKTREVHPMVLSYLDTHRDHFYLCKHEEEGTALVTARAWEDLSLMLRCLEEEGQGPDLALTAQYLQSGEVARSFFQYWSQYAALSASHLLEDILSGSPQALQKLRDLTPDQCWSTVSALLNRLDGMARQAAELDTFTAAVHQVLFPLRQLPEEERPLQLAQQAPAVTHLAARQFLLDGVRTLNDQGWEVLTEQFRTQLRQPREEAFQKTASAVEQAIAVYRRALEGTPHLEFLLQGLCNSAPLSQILLTGDHPQFRQLYQDTCFDEEAAAQALTRQTRRLARQKKKEEIA